MTINNRYYVTKGTENDDRTVQEDVQTEASEKRKKDVPKETWSKGTFQEGETSYRPM